MPQAVAILLPLENLPATHSHSRRAVHAPRALLRSPPTHPLKAEHVWGRVRSGARDTAQLAGPGPWRKQAGVREGHVLFPASASPPCKPLGYTPRDAEAQRWSWLDPAGKPSVLTVPGQIRNTLLEKRGGVGGAGGLEAGGWGEAGARERAGSRQKACGECAPCELRFQLPGWPLAAAQASQWEIWNSQGAPTKGSLDRGATGFRGPGALQFRGASSNPGGRLEADCPPRGIT